MSDAVAVKSMSNDFLKVEDQILTEEHVKKAKEELGETPETRKKCLEKLKNLIMEEKNLNALTDENFLLRFLRGKKFDVDKAFNQIKGYYTQKQNYPTVFHGIQSCACENLLDNNVFDCLPFRNTDGSAILVYRIGFHDVCSIPFEDLLRSLIICVDWYLKNPVTQICGITVIECVEGLTMNHILNVSPRRAYCFVKIFQDSIPFRLKAYHVVNVPKIYSMLHDLFKPFLSEKLKNRVILHGSDIKSLHKYIPPFILPEEFGGELGPMDCRKMRKLIHQHEKKFVENLEYGYFDPIKPFEEKFIPLPNVL